MVKFNEVVPSANDLMGVKAVWGRSEEAVMCFGSRGDAAKKDKGHYSQARITAEKAQEQPYFVTIGGGKHVPEGLRGRAIELVRTTGAYGETTAFVTGTSLRTRLEQWPVAVVLSEVYAIDGEPLLVDELGFDDMNILANAYDRVMRYSEQIEALWSALKDRNVSRRWEVQLPSGFRDPGSVKLIGTLYPKLNIKSSEGKKVWKLSKAIERDASLKREVKAQNRAKNGGALCCEACGFSDMSDGMFDAHHLQPLAAGVRESRVDDLIVLCPTCHRWAHVKAPDLLSPLTASEVAEALECQLSD
tara:strand:- start:1404 stop:2312 length:909 start_codon:yes stop_codon:yes gene_type:complete